MKANKLIGLLARNEGPPAACSYRQFCPEIYPTYVYDVTIVHRASKDAVVNFGEALEKLATAPESITEEELIKSLAKAYNEGYDLAIGRLCDLYLDPKGALLGYVRDEARRLKNGDS